MIYQMSQNENTQNQFSTAVRELQIGKLLRKSNVTKSCGVSAYEVFQFLLMLVFQGKNLFRFLNSKHRDQVVSKNTYYRFLNNDHVEHKYQKGFTLLTLGWSDGYSFIPVGFHISSSTAISAATVPITIH